MRQLLIAIPQLIAIAVTLLLSVPCWGGDRDSTPSNHQVFLESDVAQSTDGNWQYLWGEYACFIEGTFGGANIDVETIIDGEKVPTDATVASPTLKDVGDANLIDVTTATGWISWKAGPGFYRIEVEGGNGTTAIDWHCRLVEDGRR